MKKGTFFYSILQEAQIDIKITMREPNARPKWEPN